MQLSSYSWDYKLALKGFNRTKYSKMEHRKFVRDNP